MIGPAYIPPQYCYEVSYEARAPYTIVEPISCSSLLTDTTLLSRYSRYHTLKDSFFANGGKTASKEVMSMFDAIAQEIGYVAFLKAKVEYSSIMEMIQFSLSFANGMRLSFGKHLDEPKDKDVCFSLSVNNEVLVVDKKSVEDLKDVLVETIEK